MDLLICGIIYLWNYLFVELFVDLFIFDFLIYLFVNVLIYECTYL